MSKLNTVRVIQRKRKERVVFVQLNRALLLLKLLILDRTMNGERELCGLVGCVVREKHTCTCPCIGAVNDHLSSMSSVI